MFERFATRESTLTLISTPAALRAIDVGARPDADGVLWLRGTEKRWYSREPDALARVWDGDEGDPRTVATSLGAEFRDRARLDQDLGIEVASLDEIVLPFVDASLVARVVSVVGRKRRFRRGDVALRDLRDPLGAGRLVKTAVEIARLRAACARTAEAHEEILRGAWVGLRELDVALRFDLELRRRGIGETAYDTIVGAGERATVLHARAGERVIANGELVLIDAAGVWQGLCADLTRTFPAGAAFTDTQARLYRVVLDAQKQVISLARPGATLDALHECARDALAEGLRAQGWLGRETRALPDAWFPHQTSHWIGREVHDPCPYRERDGGPVVLAPGMAFTVEPGLYFRGDDAPHELRGSGVRIEDVVLITDDGAEVLTAGAPKELEVIESRRSAIAL